MLPLPEVCQPLGQTMSLPFLRTNGSRRPNYSIPLLSPCGEIPIEGTISVSGDIDTDGDGIPDITDLDDDNDGISDADGVALLGTDNLFQRT